MSAELAAMVQGLRYKRGWAFRLDYGLTAAPGCQVVEYAPVQTSSTTGLTISFADELVTLVICLETEDSCNPGKMIHVEHRFTVPPRGFIPPWHRWLLHCIEKVEAHERHEAFEIWGQRPFFPDHGPNANLYQVKDRGLKLPS